MFISLRSSSSKQEISVYTSPVVPRPGETISLLDVAPGDVLFRVVDVCYQVQNSEQGSNAVHLEVMPANEAACRYLGEMLYAGAEHHCS